MLRLEGNPTFYQLRATLTWHAVSEIRDDNVGTPLFYEDVRLTTVALKGILYYLEDVQRRRNDWVAFYV